MKETFLEKVIAKTRSRVQRAKLDIDHSSFRARAEKVRSVSVEHRFLSALSRTDRTNIIAEIKRASPSKGVINAGISVYETAKRYESGGAAAVSVLTEKEYFGGSLDDLTMVAETVDIPVLRKDFIIDEYQVYEGAAAGADAVLLIVSALTEDDLVKLLQLTEEYLGMDALVEVHDANEMTTAEAAGASIIGVNNRDLRSLEVTLDVSRRLIAERPVGALMVAESGISNRSEISELSMLGYDAFLIGETLMRSNDVARDLRDLAGRRVTV